MEIFKSFFDFTKLPTKVFVLISLLSGFLLFASDNLIQLLKLQKFIESFGAYFGVVFLFSTGFILVNLFIWLTNKVNNFITTIKLRKHFEKELRKLDHAEKAVIREFYIFRQRSIAMPINEPVVAGLLKRVF